MVCCAVAMQWLLRDAAALRLCDVHVGLVLACCTAATHGRASGWTGGRPRCCLGLTWGNTLLLAECCSICAAAGVLQ